MDSSLPIRALLIAAYPFYLLLCLLQKIIPIITDYYSSFFKKKVLPDTFLLPDFKFKFDSSDYDKLKTDHPLSPEQQAMVFSKSNNVCVAAGAGSGKSTCLVQRVIVLHVIQGIPLEDITVFSFTRATVADFKKKLSKELKKYGIEKTEEDLKGVIRTFHSKINEFKIDKYSNMDAFDYAEDYWANSSSYGLNARKRSIMHKVHGKLYNTNHEYKKIIDDLKDSFFKKLRHDKSTQDRILKQIRSFPDDYDDTLAIQNMNSSPFKSLGLVEVSIDSYCSQTKFYFNAIKDGVYILYAPEEKLLKDFFPRKESSITNTLKKKLDVLQQFFDEPIEVITSADDWHFYNQTTPNAYSAPSIAYMLEGEWSYSPLPITIFEAASFITCFGIDVEKTLSDPEFINNLNSDDTLFVKAMKLYWCAFKDELADKNMFLINDLFMQFSHDNIENYIANNNVQNLKTVLNSMSHILIDEFQDISGEITQWIRGIIKARKALNLGETSLMCVGDDYQSIYSWRGSSPQFFIEFNNYFSGANFLLIKLQDNYRSQQPIIDFAELIIAHVDNKMDKEGISKSGKEACSIKLQGSFPDSNFDISKYDVLDECFVMHRTGNTSKHTKPFSSDYGLPNPITYHRSKGLEADTVFLFGDCSSSSFYPFRNNVYKAAGFKQSYDDAQKEEALRLAYVAVTRAKKNVVWFVDKVRSGGAYSLGSKSLNRIKFN